MQKLGQNHILIRILTKTNSKKYLCEIFFLVNKSCSFWKNYGKGEKHSNFKLWRMRNLSIEVKIVVFTTLAISKLVYQILLTVIPDHITDEVTKIQKSFI